MIVQHQRRIKQLPLPLMFFAYVAVVGFAFVAGCVCLALIKLIHPFFGGALGVAVLLEEVWSC